MERGPTLDGGAGEGVPGLGRVVGVGGGDLQGPALAVAHGRQGEGDRLVVAVDQHEERVVGDALAAAGRPRAWPGR